MPSYLGITNTTVVMTSLYPHFFEKNTLARHSAIFALPIDVDKRSESWPSWAILDNFLLYFWQLEMTSGTPYIGTKISLVSKSEIRYEGILYSIDTKEAVVTLADG